MPKQNIFARAVVAKYLLLASPCSSPNHPRPPSLLHSSAPPLMGFWPSETPDLLGGSPIPRRSLPSVAVEMGDRADAGRGCRGHERMLEFEDGLPSDEDLTPLSQTLITPELASAFSISPEPPRTILAVRRASESTITSIRERGPYSPSSCAFPLKNFPSAAEDPMVIEGDESVGEDGDEYSFHKVRHSGADEEADSSPRTENQNLENSVRAQKRPRLVWTSQLHKRFVEVVAYLGMKNAVPKTIMHLMNVEGLTRENVASHLQKYRLYLKRMEGLSNEGPSSTDDHQVSPMPVSRRLREVPVPVRMPYAASAAMIPVPVFGMAKSGPGAPVTMVASNGQHGALAHHGFEANPYAVYEERRNDCASGNKLCSRVPCTRVFPNTKH